MIAFIDWRTQTETQKMPQDSAAPHAGVPLPPWAGASSNTSHSPTAATSMSAGGTVSATATLTTTETSNNSQAEEVLRLTLRGRNNVTWDESVVDNEGMGRKSSKRCCIFHKQRPFGESSTDSSDEEEGDGGKNKKRIARPKKKVPDYQRFHA